MWGLLNDSYTACFATERHNETVCRRFSKIFHSKRGLHVVTFYKTPIVQLENSSNDHFNFECGRHSNKPSFFENIAYYLKVKYKQDQPDFIVTQASLIPLLREYGSEFFGSGL